LESYGQSVWPDVLWASTGTKDPEYPDTKYVDELIGPDTINTMPPETMDACRDHGNPAPRLEGNLGEARKNIDRLGELGIDLDRVTQQLEDEGVEKFNKPYDSLISKLAKKRESFCFAKAC
jgi:transaldolase